MADYPNFASWAALTAQHDTGIAFVAMIAFFAVAWLWMIRFVYAKQQNWVLPPLRVGLVVAFYISFFLVVVGMGMGWFK